MRPTLLILALLCSSALSKITYDDYLEEDFSELNTVEDDFDEDSFGNYEDDSLALEEDPEEDDFNVDEDALDEQPSCKASEIVLPRGSLPCDSDDVICGKFLRLRKGPCIDDAESDEEAADLEERASAPIRQTLTAITDRQVKTAANYARLIYKDNVGLLADTNNVWCKLYEDAATQTAYLIFRGTQPPNTASGLLDWSRDLDVRYAKCALYGCDGSFDVHNGFQRAALYALPAVIAAINKSKMPNLVVSGHSLGGALALLTAFDLMFDPRVNRQKAPLSLVTFGQPRVVTVNGVATFQAALGNYIRYQTTSQKNCGGTSSLVAPDIVTDVPPESFGYSHFGTLKTIVYKVVGCNDLTNALSILGSRVAAHSMDNYVSALSR